MSKRKVASHRNLPIRFPVLITFLTYWSFDKWNAPEWLWGVAGIILLSIWVIVIHDKWTCERVDIVIMDKQEKGEKPIKSKFQERLKKMTDGNSRQK